MRGMQGGRRAAWRSGLRLVYCSTSGRLRGGGTPSMAGCKARYRVFWGSSGEHSVVHD
jgi:hypothetical protein